jgi:type II secretory pathway pseudopilin PulG
LSLLEVLVSLSIAALLLSWLLPGAAEAVRRHQRAATLEEAIQLARYHAESLSVWPASLPQPPRGRQGALDWQVEQVAIERPLRPQPSGTALLTFRITVRSPSVAEPLVDLTIKRLGRAA